MHVLGYCNGIYADSSYPIFFNLKYWKNGVLEEDRCSKASDYGTVWILCVSIFFKLPFRRSRHLKRLLEYKTRGKILISVQCHLITKYYYYYYYYYYSIHWHSNTTYCNIKSNETPT